MGGIFPVNIEMGWMMVDKVQANINVSAYRQLQSEIQSLIYKLNQRINTDPVIYCCNTPSSALTHLEAADHILELAIADLLYEEDEDEWEYDK